MNGGFGGRQIWGHDQWKKQLPVAQQKKFLQSFEDKRDYIRKTKAIVDRELHSRLDLLARSVNVSGRRIIVWSCAALDALRAGRAFRTGAVRLTEVTTGKIIPVDNGLFLASDIPANGYKTFVPIDRASPVPAADTSTTLDTPFYKVAFDLQRGGIASLVEKSTGREIADKTNP